MKQFIISLIVLFCFVPSFAETGEVHLRGEIIGWSNQEQFKFESVNGDENHYRLIATLPAGTHKLKVYDEVSGGQPNRGSSSTNDKELDLNGSIKSLNSSSGSGGESSCTLTIHVELRLRIDYWAKYKFSGDTDEKYHSAMKVTTCPEQLYLYGHINGSDWSNPENYGAECEDGIYKFTNVDVSGRSGGENYIAFFGLEPSVNYSKEFPRYGGNQADMATDADHNNGRNVVILDSDFSKDNDYTVSKKINVFTSSPSEGDSNFRLHDGKYNVTVNLPENTVQFTKLIEGVNTGVTEILPDGQDEAVYYTIDGIKIANPTKGLYIKLDKSGIRKIVIR